MLTTRSAQSSRGTRPTLAARHRIRQIANAVNLATPIGVLLALAGGARLRRGPHGLVVADGYRLRVPPAPAFTVGNVVIARDAAAFARRPGLLAHEARHATQYAWCAGPVFLPLYGAASLWSWLRCRDVFSHNWFERRAGLADGGYPIRLRKGRRVRS